MSLIDKEYFIGAMEESKRIYGEYSVSINNFINSLKSAPTVDAVEVVHGSWSEADDDGEYTCSHCGWVGRITCLGKDKIWSSDIDYCPYCGAKMDEVIE